MKMLEGRVEVSSLCGLHRRGENLLIAKIGCLPSDNSLPARSRSPIFQYAPSEQFTGEQMLWIAIERLVGPHDHVVVAAQIPERAGDLDVGGRRRRVAFQTLQFQV